MDTILQSNEFIITDLTKGYGKALFTSVSLGLLMFIVVQYIPSEGVWQILRFALFLGILPIFFAPYFYLHMKNRIIVQINRDSVVIMSMKRIVLTTIRRESITALEVRDIVGGRIEAYRFRIEAPGQKFYYEMSNKQDAVRMREVAQGNGFTLV